MRFRVHVIIGFLTVMAFYQLPYESVSHPIYAMTMISSFLIIYTQLVKGQNCSCSCDFSLAAPSSGCIARTNRCKGLVIRTNGYPS
eukprot:s574_g36.t1